MNLKPEFPDDAGVPDVFADSAHNEGAHILADEAWETLRADGFTRDQVIAWTETYLMAEHSGDVDSFLTWVAERESTT